MPHEEIQRRKKAIEAIEALEVELRVADARLGVAEELSWFVAFGFGLVAHLRWSSWPISIAVFVVFVWYLHRTYGRRSKELEAELQRRRMALTS